MTVEKEKEQGRGKKRPCTVGTPSPKSKGKRHQRSLELTDNLAKIVSGPAYQ
jgi:hypothetical protein